MISSEHNITMKKIVRRSATVCITASYPFYFLLSNRLSCNDAGGDQEDASSCEDHHFQNLEQASVTGVQHYDCSASNRNESERMSQRRD
jgi:hypothetical protein